MNIDINIILDALCLAVYSDTEETKTLLSQLNEIYRAYREKNPDKIDLDLTVFFDIIDDILNSELDLSRKAEKSNIILRIKKSEMIKRDKTLLDSVINILEEDPATIKPSRIKKLTRRLQQWVTITKTKQDAQQILLKCARFNTSDETTNDVLINDCLEYARKISTIQEQTYGSSETIDVVDMTDPNSVKKAMYVYKNKRRSSVFKTGLKQLNRLLGVNGGFLRGEFGAFAASSHNFKSGMLMKCARWFCTKSVIQVPQGQTPCVVFISLENEIPENSMDLIREAYTDIYRKVIPDDMSEDELIKQITNYYAQKNIKFIMYRFDENFSFVDFVKLMTQLKTKGYCVISAIIDYITLMQLEGDERDNQAKRLQRLANHFANFAKRNDILILTGLQLNSFADELNASGKTNIVRQYRSYHLSDCKGLLRELDILIYMFIEENQDGIPFLTLSWGKHRGEPRPTKDLQYAAYRFHPLLGILEDEGTDYELNLSDIYADDLPQEATSDSLFSQIKITDKPTDEPPPEDLDDDRHPEPLEEYNFG